MDFVAHSAAVLNQPLFGQVKDKIPNKPALQTNFKKKSFAITASHQTMETSPRTSLRCLNCKMTIHVFNECHCFKKKTHDEKIDFIKRNKLCFGCLTPGHSSRLCTRKKICAICQKLHPTSIHIDGTMPPVVLKTDQCMQSDPPIQVQSVNSHTLTDQKLKVLCPVLPLRIRTKGTNELIETYMGLDIFATDCFINESLGRRMKIKGTEVQISLTTMENQGILMKAQVVNDLEIIDLDGNEKTIVPVLYSRKTWPFTKDQK